MAAFSHWLKRLFGSKSRRATRTKPVRRRTVLGLEALEDRLTPALLLSTGTNTVLNSSEMGFGDDAVTVSAPPDWLRIDHGSTLDPGSSTTAGLTEENDSLMLAVTTAADGNVPDPAGSNTLIDLNSIALSGGILNVSGHPILVAPFSAIATHGGDLTLIAICTAARIAGIEVDSATADGGNILLTGAWTSGFAQPRGLADEEAEK